MTNASRQLKILKQDGSIEDCMAELNNSTICIKFEDGRSEKYEGSDYFKSMVLFREELENNGAKLLCNGARKDVYPSGMSRSMGQATKAYVLSIGEQARASDKVDIFDQADKQLVSTIEEQNMHFKKWVSSLG